MSTKYPINYKNIVVMDFGKNPSIYSTYAAVKRLSEQSDTNITFCTHEQVAKNLPLWESVRLTSGMESETYRACENSDLVLDFTEPGFGLTETMLIAERVEHFHFSKMLGDSSLLQKKIDFISLHLNLKLSVQHVASPAKISPVVTYDSSMAARMNMLGIPTIELCYRSRQHGSFLPESLVIYGDNFALIHKADLDMLFEIYQMGQMDNLFLNKPVLEMDWDLLYYQLDRSRLSMSTKKYPVTPMESFLEIFFRCFLLDVGSSDASIDRLVSITKSIDVIDIEETFKFIKNHLNNCLRDLDEENFPLKGTWWNYVRPYASADMQSSPLLLAKGVRKCIIGLEMFENIYGRQRKLLSMH
jgi:hypothetical protein